MGSNNSDVSLLRVRVVSRRVLLDVLDELFVLGERCGPGVLSYMSAGQGVLFDVEDGGGHGEARMMHSLKVNQYLFTPKPQ